MQSVNFAKQRLGSKKSIPKSCSASSLLSGHVSIRHSLGSRYPRSRRSANVVKAFKVDDKPTEEVVTFSHQDPEGHNDIDGILAKATVAQKAYSTATQEAVDQIFAAASAAANMARIPLAQLAVAETGIGLVEDKVIKNHFASEYIYNKYKNMKTVGVIEQDDVGGVSKIAEPMGVLCGIVPTTNPTSTAIFKCLLALKTRNAIVLAPHPRASNCTITAAKIVRDAAVKAGAPADIISWLEAPTKDETTALMKSPTTAMILATGGPAMVKASYSSGHPALGVGAGNTPAVIDASADIPMAVNSILLSKTFDNGVICAAESCLVVADEVYAEFKRELIKAGAHILSQEDTQRVRDGLFPEGRFNADACGKSANDLAELFGVKAQLKRETRLLIAEIDQVGPQEPLSGEKLCCALAMYRRSSFADQMDTAEALINNGGQGHTSVIYSRNQEHIDAWSNRLKTVRMLVNMPTAHGAIGDLYNFHLNPSLTLGCGTWGSTTVSTNVGPEHLLNYKTVARRSDNMLWFRVPPKVYFKSGCLEMALRELKGKRRAFIVTDKPLYDLGYTDQVTKVLEEVGVHAKIFSNIEPEPSMDSIRAGAKELTDFGADVIIALGGGSPMDAAKIMWLLYEHPETSFDGIAMRFMDIRKRVYEVPKLGEKAELWCVPSTSGTGSEVTPFAVVTDNRTHIKYPLADYAIVPSVAVVDPQLVKHMPKGLTANGGIDAFTHALESYVSVMASDYTRSLSIQAMEMLVEFLPRAYLYGANDEEAREKVHNAATIAGMAFANAFLGICHSMAHKLGARFNIPHGLANALLISHVVLYNATESPYRIAAFPQYKTARAQSDYARVADILGLTTGKTFKNDHEKVVALVKCIEDLKASLNIPPSIADVIGADRKDEFFAALPTLAAEAFDDQCTGSNPRYPLIADIQNLLAAAWEPLKLD